MDSEILPVKKLWTYAKQITITAFPLAAADVIDISSGFIGFTFLSHKNPANLAAGSVIGSIQTLVFYSVIGSMYGVANLTTDAEKSSSTETPEKIAMIFPQTIAYSLALSSIICPFMYFSGDILTGIGIKKNLALITQNYFRSYLIGLPAAITMVSWQQFLTSLGEKYFIITTSATYLGISSYLSYIFIFGKQGMLPPLNEFGLGYAHSISLYINLIIFIIYLKMNPHFKKYNFFRCSKNSISKDKLSEIFQLGKWPGAQNMLEICSIFGMTIITNDLGENALAAEQIAMQYLFILFTPLWTTSQAISMQITAAISDCKYNAATSIGNTGHIVSLIFLLIFAMPLIIPESRTSLISLFSPPNRDIKDLSSNLIIIVLITQLCDSVRQSSNGALRGYGESKAACITGIVGNTVIGLPLGYFLRKSYGAKAAFIGRGVGIATAALYMHYSWWRKKTSSPKNDACEHLTTPLAQGDNK